MNWLVELTDRLVEDLDLKKLIVVTLWMNILTTIIFTVLVIPSQLFWLHSIPWIVFMSIFAIIISGFAGSVGGIAALFAFRADSAVEIPSSGIEDSDPGVTTSQL